MPVNPYVERGIRKRSKEKKWRRQMLRKGYKDYEIFENWGSRRLKYSGEKTGVRKSRDMVKRIGVWTETSTHYSGGRIHLFQYLWCLADMGCECWLVTDRNPVWAGDYPDSENIYIHCGPDKNLPDDLDICMTDSKGSWGRRAMEYATKHNVRLAALNFETPNWMNSFIPGTMPFIGRARMAIYRDADILLANSQPSLKYAIEYAERDPQKLSDVLPPAVNTSAHNGHVNVTLPTRKYAVWSGRSQFYKCANVAIDSIMSLDKPFDFVMFGQPPEGIGSPDHKVYGYKNYSDTDKFHLMRNAHFVVAPSLFEGFGMVPSEALSVGTPCIVYDLPVLRWAYGDRLEYVPWKNPEAFKAKVRDFASKPKKNCERSRTFSINTYGLEAMKARIDSFPYHAVKRKSISAHMIAYNGAGLPKFAIESVYPHVDQIVIAYGAVGTYKDMPEDGTLDVIEGIDDKDGKITLEVRHDWENKLQMRQWCADRVQGNYHLELDGDEIWTGLDLWESDWSSPRWVNFWHNSEHWISDKMGARIRWGAPISPYGSACPHWRWSWWKPSFKFKAHHTPVDAEGKGLLDRNEKDAKNCKETVIWHLGHAMPLEYAKRKFGFYAARDGAPKERAQAWLDWNGECGDCGDGIVRAVDFDVPAIVRKAFQHLEGLENAQ